VPGVQAALGLVVSHLGGVHRTGQARMAVAVDRAAATGAHLLVQAGTGTGKSLGYLVPAVLHALGRGGVVVVATATIGLQQQIVERDLPAVVDALAAHLPRPPTVAILKGRSNYLCRYRLEGGLAPDEDVLFEPAPTSALGQALVRVHEWARTTRTGDRDELGVGVDDRAWAQVSVGARECLGAARCPAGGRCFAEAARAAARAADIVVTNHALLALDAVGQVPVLPEHDLLVVDEAHELADRVRAVATACLSPAAVARARTRVGPLVEADSLEPLAQAERAFAQALEGASLGRFDALPPEIASTLQLLLAAVRGAHSTLAADREAVDGRRTLARAALDAVGEPAERLLTAGAGEVVWSRVDERGARALCTAPLTVGDQLREAVFGRATVVLTSATLTVGGRFEHVARECGLTVTPPSGDASDTPDRAGEATAGNPALAAGSGPAGGEPPPRPWQGIDVGSPFDYRHQGILYIAAHLPAPGREGPPEEALSELAALVRAAGGRTLGLFSSIRAARRAADTLRGQLDVPLLVQGEGRLAGLVRQFATDEESCLFGTLSLWQGVDVPGPSCHLVVIDRLPFPRPDDPLMSARARDVDRHGGNGFLAVSVAHAAVRLAQGAGRLIRSADDRGVVAVLDPRLATARYGGVLRASLPPFWSTTDRVVALAALRRLRAARADGRA
jgi:ATP-dependent DNA helicase DinG